MHAPGGPSESIGEFSRFLAGPELQRLEERGRKRLFKRGATLFNEGDLTDHVALVTSGRVKVSCSTDEGREILLAIRESGDLLGEFAALDGEGRSATATALEPVEAILVSGESFRSFLEEHPHISLLMLKSLVSKLRDADRKRIEFGAVDSVGRVAARLLELADRFGEASEEGIRISLPLTQQELAGFIGASREAVSKALHTLKRSGCIETGRKEIVVLDAEALARRAT